MKKAKQPVPLGRVVAVSPTGWTLTVYNSFAEADQAKALEDSRAQSKRKRATRLPRRGKADRP